MQRNMRLYLWISIVLLFTFTACSSGNSPLVSEAADTYDAAATDGHYYKTVYATKNGVEEFLTLLGDFDSKNKGTLTSGYKHNYNTCYNITPEEIKHQNPECKIFKFSESCLSYLQYEDELCVLGESFGGLGVVDMKLADINEDGEKELYFTYSWGSGLHRSHIAYYDFKGKTGRLIDYVYMDNDMMIVEDKKGSLSLYHANISSDDDTDKYFVEYSLKSGELLGKLVYKDGGVIVE